MCSVRRKENTSLTPITIHYNMCMAKQPLAMLLGNDFGGNVNLDVFHHYFISNMHCMVCLFRMKA